MSQPKSKPTSGWAALLQAEVQRRGTAWGPEHLTFEQIQEMRKQAGVPWGAKATTSWLSAQVEAKKVKRVDGLKLSDKNKLVRETRYLLLK